MIPEFDASGNLPPGVHSATWEEFDARFGIDAHRGRLLAGLKVALLSLKAAGCKRVYVDGSFVTNSTFPGDFDVCWDTVGVDLPTLQMIEPVLFEFRNRRAGQKAKFGGELFPAHAQADGAGRAFLEFFQSDKDTGQRKGIVQIDLEGLK